MRWTYLTLVLIGILILVGVIMYKQQSQVMGIPADKLNGFISKETIPLTQTTYSGNYKVISKSGNESLYDVIITKNKSTDNSLICLEAGWDSKQVDVYKYDNKIEEEIIDYSYNYSVPDTLSFYKSDKLTKQADLTKTKINQLSLASPTNPNRFCYEADPSKDFYLKFGDNSVVVIQENLVVADAVLVNVTAETNFTHLNISTEAPYNNLVGYWNFDGDKEELLGRVTGKVGNALNFDGVSNYVVIPYVQSLNINKNLTISAWINASSLTLGEDVIIGLTTDTDITTSTQYALYLESDNQVNFLYKGKILDSGMNVDDNTWHHLVVVANDTNMTLYVDNVAKVTGDASGAINLETYDITIGGENDGLEPYLGLIDEVRIWNRSLSTIEIANIFGNETAGQTDSNMDRTGLVGEWTFNETSGFIANDSSGEGNIGKMNMAIGTAYDFSKNNNDGTYTGQATVSLDCGLYGKGSCFDGKNDYVDCGDINSLDGASSFAVSVWYKPHGVDADDAYHSLVSKYANTFSIWLATKFNGANQYTYFAVYNSSYQTTPALVNYGWVTADFNWQHWVGVYNGTAVILYKNGILIEYQPLTGPTRSSSDNVAIGGRSNALSSANGTIDEVMIFNTSLTDQQILDIYNNQSARFAIQGTQDIVNQSYMNITSGNNRVNVTTYIDNLLGSSINLSVGYYDTGWSYTDPQVISSGVLQTFNISSTSTNLTLNYTFYAGNSTYPFYSPILKDNITFVAWYEEEGEADTSYPLFSTYWDNNGSLVDSGTALFNVTVENTNGSVYLNINGSKITAKNITANVYNASYDFGIGGNYIYNWTAYGNGSNNNLNISENRWYYVNVSAIADCWSKTGNVLFIPKGCVYQLSKGESYQI